MNKCRCARVTTHTQEECCIRIMASSVANPLLSRNSYEINQFIQATFAWFETPKIVWTHLTNRGKSELFELKMLCVVPSHWWGLIDAVQGVGATRKQSRRLCLFFGHYDSWFSHVGDTCEYCRRASLLIWQWWSRYEIQSWFSYSNLCWSGRNRKRNDPLFQSWSVIK